MMLRRFLFSVFVVLLLTLAASGSDLLVPDGYSTIQSAVNASSSGDRIIVDVGTYNEHVGISKGVILMSTDPDNPTIVSKTIIDAGGSGSAVTISGNDNELRGFTITGGNSGGIKCSGGNITIANCTITENHHVTPNSGKGGGISNSSANLTVIDCTFTGNTALGSGGNGGYGGGIFSDTGELMVIGCEFIGNSSGQEGGAIANDYYKTTIKDSVFIGNDSDTGGAINSSHYPSIISNCTFINNMARLGGAVFQKGLYLGDMTCRINNCTFYENIATEFGGAAGIGASGDLVIRSSILWNNIAYVEGPQISGGSSSNLSFSYSCIQGGQSDIYGGGSLNWLTGNINADPLLADTASGDLHLRSQGGRWNSSSSTWVLDSSHSPCIDAGDPVDPNWIEEARPSGKRVNMGAFGGTAEASKSLSTGGNIADINSSGSVDAVDLNLLAEKWLSTKASLNENLNGDEIVNIEDFAILASNWGWSE